MSGKTFGLSFSLILSSAFAQGIITTTAGTEWVFNADGKAALEAPVGRITAVTLDPAGNPVFADQSNAVVIRLNPDGHITVLAGNGIQGYSGDGGPAISAALNSPQAAAFDSKGNLYIADTGNNRIRMVTPDGIIRTAAGTGKAGATGDGGPATNAALSLPINLVIDALDNLYINDRGNAVIRKVTASGIISTYAGTGQSGYSGDNGPATKAMLNDVEGMAVDGSGNLYLADFGNNRVRKVDTRGIITTVAGNGQPGYSGDGSAAAQATLKNPGGVAVDGVGNLYISDTNNFVIRKVTAQGVISSFAGTDVPGYSGDTGPAANATMRGAFGLAVDVAGNLYIADRDNYRLRKITGTTITTLAGNGAFGFFPEGTAAVNAYLFQPFGVSVDANRNVYVADNANNRVRKITPDGAMFTLAGNGGNEYSGDGGPATAAGLSSPTGVAADRLGNIYIADAGNNRVRRIGPNGTITTVAGDDGSLSSPAFVLLDSAGNLYISDFGNNRVRRMAPDGTMSIIAGNGRAGYSGDGAQASLAGLNGPAGLALDAAGNLYIADFLNARVRRVTPAGVITTIAGGGTRSDASADSFPATQAALGRPWGVAIDNSGSIYFSDLRYNRVRRISPGGILSTAAGNGTAAFSGDGGLSTSAALNQPGGLALDAAGNLLIADIVNNRIRAVLATPGSFQVSPASLSFSGTSGGNLTDAQNLSFSANVPGLAYTLSAATRNGGSWLKVNPVSGSMPAAVQVTADPTGLAAGTYQGSITVSAPNANPPTQTATVTFTVAALVPPRLGVGADAVTFSFVQGDSAASRQVAVLNQGGGNLAFSAVAATDSGAPWLTISPAGGSATPVVPAAVSVQADPSGLDQGTYTGTVTLSSGAGGTAQFLVTMTISAVNPKILLSPAGLKFTAVSGGGAPLPQSFGVLNAGPGALNWTVQSSTLFGGSDWLIVTPPGGSVASGAASVPLVNVAVQAANLDPGEYYGQVQIFSDGAVNSPQTVSVVLDVLDAGSNPGPEVRPTGLIFTGTAGASPGSQNIFISNLTNTKLSFASGRVTEDGQNWFVNAPTNSTVVANQPARVVVQPDFTNLAPGVRHGVLTFLFDDSNRTVRTVDVLTVVAGGTGASAAKSGGERDASGCSPNALQVAFASPAPNFSVLASQPATIQVTVVDNCGAPLPANVGKVVARFSNGDDNLDLVSMGNGVWTRNWQPRNTSSPQVRIAVDALWVEGSKRLAGEQLLSGTLRTGATTPAVNSGVQNAASFVVRPLVAPGGLITVFGERLADPGGSNPSPPLSTELGGTQVLLDDRPLALLYTSDGQINAQVPYDLSVNTQHQLRVRRNTALSVPEDVTVAPSQPAIFSVSQDGKGQGVIWDLHADGAQVLADPSAPASAGDVIVIYCAGLGVVAPGVDLGQPAPSLPPSQTVNPPLVTIGGQPAQVVSASLVPDSAGLYQVQAVVPRGITPGSAVPVVLTVAGQTSPTVTMAVQ